MASEKRSDGEGSIHYDKSRDRWVGTYVTGWRDGKPIRKKVTAKSKSAAAARLRELREKVQAGELPKGRPPTVTEWMTYWLEQIVEPGVRPSTLRGYRTSVEQHITPLLGDHRVDRLTPEHVEKAWRHLTTIGNPLIKNPAPLSPVSARQAHRALSQAFGIAHKRGLVRQNVVALARSPRVPDKEMEVLTRDQAERVLAVAAERRNAARWRVALSLGLRQGEALGLTWEYVDLDEGTLSVRQALSRVKGQGLVFGPVKSRAGRRTILLPAYMLTQLRSHRTAQNAERLACRDRWQDEHGLVFATPFGAPIDPRADWGEWKSILAEAGVPDVRLHAARHSAVTMMLAAGVPTRAVMDIVGHSQISVTSKYQHVVNEVQEDAARKMDAYWG